MNSFSHLYLFICFFYLTALDKTPRAILNEGGEIGPTCHVPSLSRNTLNFPSFNLKLAIGLLYIAFIMLDFSGLLTQRYTGFCQKLFCTYQNDHSISLLESVNLIYNICCLQMLNHHCFSEIKLTWSWRIIFAFVFFREMKL